MGFTTSVFLFVFFPLCAAGLALDRLMSRFTFWERIRLRDWMAVGFSLAFYAWALFDGVFWLCGYIILVYAAARLFQALRGWRLALPLRRENDERFLNSSLKTVLFVVAVCAVIACLIQYKYLDFALGIWNRLFSGNAAAPSLTVPLGLSFLTFSAISYLADVHRGQAPVGSLLDCALYLSFFPKVASGPIVLWKDFQPQIARRRTGLDDISAGVERIILGFAKKLILADMFGACLKQMGGVMDVPTGWLAALLYMLQIYYDFAGYSDIAIGLGKLFGFHFKNNFDFPYRSRSITEFWRRWHISLGSWFREYVYFPLGGSRLGLRRTLWNLTVVFALTGIWHGAGWNYILWGGVNAFFVLLERVIREKAWYKRIPDGLKWFGTMLVVLFFWELFRFQSLGYLWFWLKIMLGLNHAGVPTFTWQYYLDTRTVFLIAVGVLGATVLGGERVRNAYDRFSATAVGLVLRKLGLLALFTISVLCMVNSTYSPFIYFQY